MGAVDRRRAGLPDGFPHAITGFADLAGPGVGATLDAMQPFARLKGIRQQVHWHENPSYRFAPRPDIIADDQWRRGLAQLAPRGLLFELQVFAPQMALGAELARAFPQTTFVLQHAGMLEDLSDAGRAAWRNGMRQLADCPNVFVKLSALGTFVHRATLADIQPIVSDTVTLFGAERCLWGSNFPIEKIWTDYTTVADNIRRAVAHLPPHEQRQILSETAARHLSFVGARRYLSDICIMNDFADALYTAVSLIGHLDADLRQIVSLSLGVSLTASICAFVIGAPVGTALAVYRFPGRGGLIVIANALLGLPPVVVGLVVYLLLSRSGPLGSFGILFTPTAMVIAQAILGIPIVIALVHRMTVDVWAAYGDALLVDGASRLRALGPIMLIGRDGLLTAFLAAFGRAIAEVGADYHRRRQYPRLYPHDDHGHRLGDEQGRIELRSCFGDRSHHPVHGRKRAEPRIRTCSDGPLNERQYRQPAKELAS